LRRPVEPAPQKPTSLPNVCRLPAKVIKPSDPWMGLLRNIRGQVGFDRVDRIATEAIFEQLEVPTIKHTPEAAKGLRALMVGSLAVCRTLQPRSSSSGSARTAFLSGRKHASTLTELLATSRVPRAPTRTLGKGLSISVWASRGRNDSSTQPRPRCPWSVRA
jgi:hypothetical protein